MRHIYIAVIISTVISGPALAADADSHAAHHPQATSSPATPPAKKTEQSGMMDKCPMMQGSGGQKPMDCSSMMKAQPDSKPKSH